MEMDVEELEYQIGQVNRFAVVQSICDFNLFWVATLSTLVCTMPVIDFLCENMHNIKRKLSVAEFMRADFVIANLAPVDFSDFTLLYKAFTPELMYNLKAKSAHLVVE